MTSVTEKSSKNEAIVKPELLVWARENTGLSIEEAAKKIGIKPERLLACESGEARLTINQLRNLSNAYKRPLAIFFLSEPPPKEVTLRDFRQLPDEEDRSESPQLRYEIRRAKYRRKVALEMFEELGYPIQSFTLTATLTEQYEKVAMRIRDFLDVKREKQFGFRNPYEALRGWRTAFEEKNILVFQASKIDLSEMRGFSIFETQLPIVVMNSKDTPYGRIFTMLHEFTHLMLRMAGLCDLEESQQIETFCNMVAGATLIPREWLLAEETVIKQENKNDWSNFGIKALANKYSVSREVVLRRLVINGHATETFYRKKREELLKEYEARKADEGGFSTPDVTAVNNAGRLFTKLVLESYNHEKITSSDVTDFLEVRFKHLNNIEKAVSNYTI